MPSQKRSGNFRIAAPSRKLLDALGEYLGLANAPLIELLIRQAHRGEIPRPDALFQRWHDNAGITEPFNRRLSGRGLEMLAEVAAGWSLSQSDLVEYLIFYRAVFEGLAIPRRP